MADDTSSTPAPVATARLGVVQILMIVAFVTASQLGVGFLMMSVENGGKAEAGEAPVAEEESGEIDFDSLEPANYLPLDPPLIVNLKHDGEPKLLQVSVQLMTRDREFFEKASNHAPAIRDSLLLLFGDAEYGTVTTIQGKEELRERAIQTAEDVMMRLTGKQGIEGLYFTNFVVQ